MDIGLISLFWAAAVVLLIMATAYARRDTIVEITPRKIVIRRRWFIRAVEKQSYDLSAFAEARRILVHRYALGGPGNAAGAFVPELVFAPTDVLPSSPFLVSPFNVRMLEAFVSDTDADAFVNDINASVERARNDPANF